MATSFRAQLRAGCKTILDAYQAANPTLLLHTYDAPPESFHTPLAYVEKGVTEALRHANQIRFRTLRVNIVIVNKLIDNEQAAEEQDALVDGLIDYLTDNPSAAVSNSLLEPVLVSDSELADANGTRFSAAIITVEGQIQEGRA
jgi:hypothetical protein